MRDTLHIGVATGYEIKRPDTDGLWTWHAYSPKGSRHGEEETEAQAMVSARIALDALTLGASGQAERVEAVAVDNLTRTDLYGNG